MNNALENMLKQFLLETREDKINALREIFQHLALLGLWRSKFFEHAAFYGGTALRILYGLDRFSEDIDFSLLNSQSEFDFNFYLDFIQREIQAFGFQTDVQVVNKKNVSPIVSGFLKANTQKMLLVIKAETDIIQSLPHNQNLKIKIEIDTDPAVGFTTETKFLLMPIPFSVRAYSLPDLFAGKMHALLCRNWKNRVKGRDWYDLIWYLSHHPELNLRYLESKMKQTGHLSQDSNLTSQEIKTLLIKAIEKLDVKQAKQDVMNFIRNQEVLSIWSRDFFKSMVQKIIFIK